MSLEFLVMIFGCERSGWNAAAYDGLQLIKRKLGAEVAQVQRSGQGDPVVVLADQAAGFHAGALRGRGRSPQDAMAGQAGAGSEAYF